MIKWLTVILAIAGLGMGIYTVATSAEKLPDPPPDQPPSVNPYASGIAAVGLVEAASRDIEIAAPEPGLVVEVVARPNALVHKGDPLFIMDHRLLDAQLVRARADLAVAQADLDRIKAQPRKEDLPPLEAGVATAKVLAADAQDQYERMQVAFNGEGANEGELVHRRFEALAAKAAVVQAQANLDRLLAGPWAQDVDAAEARVTQAQAEITALNIQLARTIVRAPIDGTVMKRFVEPGEYASANPTMPAIVLGDLSSLHVRAQVDEEDTPLLSAAMATGASAIPRGASPAANQDNPGTPAAKSQIPNPQSPISSPLATARLRGPLNREYALHLLRIEPLAQAKMNLTGGPTERVDTRVVDVVFALEPPADGGPLPYPGELVDVFIQTKR